MTKIKRILNLLLVPVEYLFDTARTFKWSKASILSDKQKQLHYDILLLAHTVEKGLSVKNTRLHFGKLKITQLLNYLDEYDFQWNSFPLSKSYGCLNEYLKYHVKNDYDLGDFGKRIKQFIEKCEKNNIELAGGTKSIDLNSLSYKPEFALNLQSRFSSRQYEDKIVKDEVLSKIFAIVRQTPSQCNRQSSKVHLYQNPDDINDLLILQGGAEGFRENVKNLFIISNDLTSWSGFKARSQTYVDGSLFAMQVLNACQAMGLGACPLNLAVSNSKELKIIKRGGIPKSERLIMMISFGYPVKQKFKVAKSARQTIQNFVTKH